MKLRRREFTILACGALLGTALSRPAAAVDKALAPSSRAAKLYQRSIVIDALCIPGGFEPGLDENAPLTPWMIDDVRACGVTAVNATFGAVGNLANVFEATVAAIAQAEHELQTHPDVFMKITRAQHIEEAKKSKRLGLIYGFQDGSMLGTDVDRVDLFYRLGVRVIQPTYNTRNLLGDGCLEAANGGLSTFGRQVIERMNSLGILVDLSHCGQQTTAEGIATSAKPVAITHTGCQALADRPRNKRDAELRTLAQKGGVVGIYFMPFLRMSGQPTSADAIAHLEHAIDVCGEDHVGIGSDGPTSGFEVTPEFREYFRKDVQKRRSLGISAPGEDENVFTFLPDLNTPRRLETLADLLIARGHSEARVEKILGGNFARLFREVWKDPLDAGAGKRGESARVQQPC